MQEPASEFVRLRVRTEDGEAAIGPGKADLLELIEKTGSLSSAAREMGMSYRRAWGLVAVMNLAFRQPLVKLHAGGAAGGGAELTLAGRKVLRLYRVAGAAAYGAAQEEIAQIRKLISHPKKI